MNKSLQKAILAGGLVAGTLNVLAAFLLAAIRRQGPDQVLHFIASGLLGVRAFRGGVATGALGLLCHYLIALGCAAVYCCAARTFPILRRRATACGLLYGIPVYAITNFLIIPLSRIGWRGIPGPSGLLINLVILMLSVGLPIATVNRKYT